MNYSQIPQIIYQYQYTYWFWSLFLNLYLKGHLFLGLAGNQILFLAKSEKGGLLTGKTKESEGLKKDEVEWFKDDVKWTNQEGLKEIPQQEICFENEPFDCPQPPKPVDDLILPKPRFDQISLRIQASSSKKSSTQPAKEQPLDSKNYKSPPKKLLVFFERSRDNWKNKCLDTKDELKLAKKNIKNLRASNKRLKEKVKCLEAEVSKLYSTKEVLERDLHELQKTVDGVIDTAQSLNVVPARHQYPIGVIYLYVSLVLTASTSLRGATKALEVFISTLNLDCSIPSWPGGRLWLLRLGYYKLTRTKEKSDDWIWIADHITQLDDKKCFAINGIRQSHLSNLDRALIYEDLEPLALLPVTESSGKIVFNQLEQTIEQTGIPREIIGDYGSDLKKGCEEFCKKYPQTSYIHDIKHKTALILKHEFEKDRVWQKFTKLSSQTKQKIQQTSLAFLNPKNQRLKARYMNIDALIKWGIELLAFVEEQAQNPSKELDQKALKKKLGWIRNYKKTLQEWNEILQMVSITEQLIREKGIRFNSYSLVKKELLPISSSRKRVTRFKQEILDFIKLEGIKVGLREKLLGSSEIIESTFGKLKELEKEQSKSGFTGLVLILAAIVSKTSMDILQKALESVPVKKVLDWCRQNLGESVQSKKKKYLKGYKRKKFPQGYQKKEQKRGKLLLPI